MPDQEARIANLDRLLSTTASLMSVIADCLRTGVSGAAQSEWAAKMRLAVENIQQREENAPDPLSADVLAAVDTLAGQVRMIGELASRAMLQGAVEFARQERTHPLRLQIANWVTTLRANLTPRSIFFRHAVRLSVCVALGDGIGRMISWQRSYWIPMTIAVVLKPDFTTTFSRGVLRLAGTFTGLVLATLLYHLIPPSALTELFLVGIFTFLTRSVGPANFGIFSIAISALIVFLLAETGISPCDVVLERGANTIAGGLFALLAYAVWPTWERGHVSGFMAETIDAARHYFRGIAQRFGLEQSTPESQLDRYRIEWRRTRSAAEASVDRVASEPRTKPGEVRCLTSMLASSHALVHSMMALEAAVIQGRARTAPETFRKFSHDVELTLYFLAAALRGSTGALTTLPELREDHSRMVKARLEFSPLDELVLIETDRLTSSLNTLREQVIQYTG